MFSAHYSLPPDLNWVFAKILLILWCHADFRVRVQNQIWQISFSQENSSLLLHHLLLLQTWVKNTLGINSALAFWDCRRKYFYRMKAVTPLSALLTSLRLMILTPDIPGGYNSWPRTSPEDTITLKDKQICLEALSPWVWMKTFHISQQSYLTAIPKVP